MTDVVFRKLPHGKIPYQTIANANLKDALMKVNENMVALERMLKSVCQAINELRRSN